MASHLDFAMGESKNCFTYLSKKRWRRVIFSFIPLFTHPDFLPMCFPRPLSWLGKTIDFQRPLKNRTFANLRNC